LRRLINHLQEEDYVESKHSSALQADNEAKLWKKRFKADDAKYDEWERKFRCVELEKYFEGFQWKVENEDYRPYVINLFFSSIQTKIPSLLFNNPSYNLIPRPWKDDFDPDTAWAKARLKEDVLNSFVSEESNQVTEAFEDLAYDGFFRFGVIEVGYEASWLFNPKAEKPSADYTSDETDPEEIDITPGKPLPADERIFTKAIDPSTFRIGGEDSRQLEKCGRCHYFEFARAEDILQDNSLENLDKLEVKGIYNDAVSEYEESDLNGNTKRGLFKLRHVFDHRNKERLLIDDQSGYVLKRFKYKKHPIEAYTPIRTRTNRGFYPIPIAFNWISPQDEQNEIKEVTRAHRRKFKRAFISPNGSMSDVELAKVIHGGDGEIGICDNPDPSKVLFPVPSAPMDPSARDSLITSKDDFNIISATSAEERGESDRVTATQATLTNQRSQIREDHDRSKFARFLCKVGRKIIYTHTKLVDDFWVKRFADSEEVMFTEVQKHQYTWDLIQADDLEGEDYSVDINITSLSPISNEQEKKKLYELLAALNTYPQLAFSPFLIRELMDRIGYRNEKVAQQFQNMAMMQMMGAVQAMQQQASGLAQQNMAKATPNDQEKVQNQLTNQVGKI
jgi:hypothetical protein